MDHFSRQFPGKNTTVIEKLEFNYSVSKKGNPGGATAAALQFPLRLAFASTAHKVQGLTVKKPSSLVLDLQSVREPAQAYVMFSRVQALSQLFIIGSLCPEKIKACPKALAELDRMGKTAINMSEYRKSSIVSCNIRCLQKNFDDLQLTSCFKNARVVCLQETWLVPTLSSLNLMEKNGWKQWNICVGRGKGITTLYKSEFKKRMRDMKIFNCQKLNQKT